MAKKPTSGLGFSLCDSEMVLGVRGDRGQVAGTEEG